ncbi:MAG: flagellar hook-associated protein FlgK [Lachnospiraceae bacterium]|nr:flagellar hook-associated protein FlgK [Lachnospiraceae bacterium]
MPLMGSLYVGTTGLQTSQNALNTTGHNLTNADTVGYVRQQTMLGDRGYNTISIDATAIANKQLGLGVNYSQIRQVRDVFLDQTYREESGRLAFYETYYSAIEEVETLLGEMDGASFQLSLDGLWVAIQEIAKDPDSSVTQGLLMQRAYTFMTDAKAVYQGLCDYQDNLNRDIKNMVDQINDYGAKIKDLNEQIIKIETGGIEKANDLKDERNKLVDELSSLANIDYMTDAFGNTLVKIEGHMFVTPEKVNEIGYQLDDAATFYNVFWKDDAKLGVDSDGREYYEDVEDAAVFDLSQEIATSMDTDLGELKALMVTRGDHRANYTDLMAKYDEQGEEVISANESYSNISDSVIMTVQAEFDRLVHGVVTVINGALEEAWANSGGAYMSDGRGNPMQIFQRETAEVREEEDINESETLFTTANLIINMELMQTPAKLSFKKPDGSVDYETAEIIKRAFEEKTLVLNPENTNPMGLSDYYSSLVAHVANNGAVYKSIRDNEQITVDSTENARQQIIGVSTDEELSNMIRFQNAYNASSRYINVISEMLEHLLNALG